MNFEQPNYLQKTEQLLPRAYAQWKFPLPDFIFPKQKIVLECRGPPDLDQNFVVFKEENQGFVYPLIEENGPRYMEREEQTTWMYESGCKYLFGLESTMQDEGSDSE